MGFVVASVKSPCGTQRFLQCFPGMSSEVSTDTGRGEIAALDPSNAGPPTPAGQQEEEQAVLLAKIWDLTVSVTFCLMLAKWDFLCHRA